MFTSARFKLTAWYLLIIMLISLSFSFVIYKSLTSELDRVERMQRQRQLQQLPSELSLRYPRAIDPEIIDETKNRLIMRLILTNLGIFIMAGVAGYFLAGRTLRPIKEMVDEQNRFITDASHELRTPITSLKSEIEVNLRDKKLPILAKEILESNLEDVNNLQTLSDNLIRLSQFQKGNGTIFENISLTDVITESVKKVGALAKHKNITIKNNVKNVLIEGDNMSLKELFVIFLDNAIKYSNKNTIITLNSRKTDHSVVVEIKDQGMGISKEDLPHLFDRFYRADLSRGKDSVPGYGLGLSIAKQIIEKHKGSIKVESEESGGTTFFIKLPTEG